MTQSHTVADCPFCAILSGEAPGTIIARDDANSFALIQSIHPESSVHWMALPMEHVASIEELEQLNQERFLKLVDFAIQQAKNKGDDYPDLIGGYTLKLHFGAFETVPHAKVHILAVE
jgi:diadenosine tetraphosphate (Ap4A) HIT family hydrolase